MQMSTHEIVQMYKEAADKNAQIEILADLNVCSKQEILTILQEQGLISGVKLPKKEAKKEQKSREKLGSPQTLALEGEEETGRSGVELSEVGKRVEAKRRATRMTWTEELKDSVRRLCGEGLSNLEIAERLGLDEGQIKNAVTRYKLRKDKPEKGAEETTPKETAKRLPLEFVSLIRDYAKCITLISPGEIQNYREIVGAFAGSIMEAADEILCEAKKYGQ